MASVGGIAAINNLALTHCPSPKQCLFLATHQPDKLKLQSLTRISIGEESNSLFKRRNNFNDFRVVKSVQLDVYITSDDEDEMGEGFFAAIEELERMAREPSDVLEEMNERLSARELQLVLV